MAYYIGADLGTSSLKLILSDDNGKIINSVTESYEVFYPKPGWSEQSPDDWWNAFVNGVLKLTEGQDAEKIKAIGIAGQMHGLVILDEKDEVIRPAILWNDGRCSKETAYLNEAIGKNILSGYTGNIAFAGFTAPKILWLKNNEEENFNRIKKIMLPKDYLNYRLTGIHATDYSDASGMLLLDVKNRCWSKEMLEICKVKEENMPGLFESYECIGTLKPEIAKTLNLSQDVKVAAGAGDNAGAAIGTKTIGKGKCNISLGTSGTVFISSDRFSVDDANSLHSFCHADGGFHLMACILSAASCNKWFCEKILNTENFKAEEDNITQEMIEKSHVYFLPYLMGERSPINDTDATGMFIGLRPDTSRYAMLLSVLEGVSFAIKDNIEIAKSLGIDIRKSTVCGGGAKSQLWLKILSSILNIELHVPKAEEGPGYGATKLAMVASGKFKNLSECVSVKIKEVIKPEEKLVLSYERKYDKFKKIYPAVKNLYKELKEEN